MKTPLLKSIILCLLVSLVLNACTSSKALIKLAKGKTLSIVVVTDLHYLDPSLSDQGPAFINYMQNIDGRMLHYSTEIIDAFVDTMIESKPDILIISGDLTNNGELKSHLALAEKFKKIEAEAPTRIYIIPGNHDIQNAWAREFVADKQVKTETVSWTKFRNLYADFGYDEAILKDKVSLSYLATPSEDVWLLMLDTNSYSKTERVWVPYSNGRLLPETLEWIKTCTALAKAKGARIITVMHHNLLNHNELFTGFALDNTEDVRRLFHDEDLDIVLSGHLHIQDIRKDVYSEDPLVDIVTSTLLMAPFQYGSITMDPKTGFDYVTKQVDVEGWAKQNQRTDPNLLNFKTYAINYFWQASYNKVYARLMKVDKYTATEMEMMARTMADLNIYFYNGRSDLISDQIRLSPGYAAWTRADEPEFTKDYILLMARKSLMDNNHIHIDW